MDIGYRAERLFAELCSRHFLRGFVFHSPRFAAPTECEAGDVVLWVRRQLVVVEVVAREAAPGASTRQFVKRIGEKRRQLLSDHAAYTDPDTRVVLVNESGEPVPFELTHLDHVRFSGIILIDHDGPLAKPHVESIRKTLDAPFPIAVLTRQDFVELLDEVDTVPDLSFYLSDRADFVREVFAEDPGPFLRLGRGLERNLVAYYKLHDNRFPVGDWKPEEAFTLRARFRATRRAAIASRDAENDGSYLIDDLAHVIREASTPSDSTLLHAAELASFTRRQRAAGLAEKIDDAFEQMMSRREHRTFAVFNPMTGCWCAFYFHHGDDSDAFRAKAYDLTRLKLFVEMRRNGFEHSVFGFAFRKSPLSTPRPFDELVLSIEDAETYEAVPDADYRRATAFFGGRQSTPVAEFPE